MASSSSSSSSVAERASSGRPLIRHRRIEQDDFRELGEAESLPASGRYLLSLERYLALWESWDESRRAQAPAGLELGVQLPTHQEWDKIPGLDQLALVVVQFERFTDGRGYSLAQLLRSRAGYRGELRAAGWVTREQLLALERVGFDAFELKAGKNLESALEAFTEFSFAYQATAQDSLPLFRRRHLK